MLVPPSHSIVQRTSSNTREGPPSLQSFVSFCFLCSIVASNFYGSSPLNPPWSTFLYQIGDPFESLTGFPVDNHQTDSHGSTLGNIAPSEVTNASTDAETLKDSLPGQTQIQARTHGADHHADPSRGQLAFATLRPLVTLNIPYDVGIVNR